ncbi:MAG: RNA polymerase sigma factor [Acidobacteriota bacterium]
MERSDEQLMLEVRSGDESSLGTLFERHHEGVYRYLLRMTGQPQISEDLVQDAFIRVLRYRQSFRDDSHFRPWLYRVAHNVGTDHFNRSSKRPEYGTDELEAVDEAPGSQEQLESRERVGLMQRALAALPAEKRELLILARYEALPYAEIGELLDCSVGAVKVRVHRATATLRQEVERLAKENEHD